MAHNLNVVNGKVALFSTEKAWHGLGQIDKGSKTSEQAIELAGLNYDVIKVPVLANVGGEMLEVPEKFATLRTDTKDVFGIVGNRYEIVQNRDAFGFFDNIVGQGQAIFETAGALGKGERIFVTAKMPNYVRIAGTDDVSEVYVILTSSHDGSGAVIAGVTAVRIVCQNTLRLALKGLQNKVSIRYTTNVQAGLAQAGKLMGIVNTYTEALNATVNSLSLKRVSDVQVKELVENLFPSESENSTRIENIRNEVLNSYFTGIGQDKIKGTAWGVLNGITHYTSHIKNYKDADTKFENLLMDGASSKLVDKATELLLAM